MSEFKICKPLTINENDVIFKHDKNYICTSEGFQEININIDFFIECNIIKRCYMFDKFESYIVLNSFSVNVYSETTDELILWDVYTNKICKLNYNKLLNKK